MLLHTDTYSTTLNPHSDVYVPVDRYNNTTQQHNYAPNNTHTVLHTDGYYYYDPNITHTGPNRPMTGESAHSTNYSYYPTSPVYY